MELSKSLLSISLTILLIAACSSVQVTEESVTESSIATVEVSSPETYQTKTAAISTSATIYFDFDKSNLTSTYFAYKMVVWRGNWGTPKYT